MSRFGPDPQNFFTEVYRETAPWDVGHAQPALTALFDAYPPGSPVLDVGCGTGDLAIALAQRGFTVLGVDFVEAAITEARRRAAALPPEVQQRLTLRVADALRPSVLGAPFGAIVDSGFLHLFDDAERHRFVQELALALRPGGRYYVLAFAVTFPGPQMPRAVDEDELRNRFAASAGWRILYSAQASFESRVGVVPAVAACVERVA